MMFRRAALTCQVCGEELPPTQNWRWAAVAHRHDRYTVREAPARRKRLRETLRGLRRFAAATVRDRAGL